MRDQPLTGSLFNEPLHDEGDDPVDILEGLISPVPAQMLVAPPPSSPPPTKPGQSTPVTGSLATPPSQAKPRVAGDGGSASIGPRDPRSTPQTGIRRFLERYLSQHPLNAASVKAVKSAAKERLLRPAILGATNQPQVVGSRDLGSGRLVTQPSDNPAVDQALATSAMPYYTATLKEVVQSIPGARITTSRSAKNPKRLAEKIEQEMQPAQTVSDYGAAQISVDSEQAKLAVIQALKARFPVLAARDFFERGDPKYGYRVYSMQLKMPNGSSEELQILPREVQQANKKEHREYKAARTARLAGLNAETPETAAKKINNHAMEKFNLRNLVKGSAVRLKDGSKGVIAYLDPNFKIARVRTEDGRNLTVRRRDLS